MIRDSGAHADAGALGFAGHAGALKRLDHCFGQGQFAGDGYQFAGVDARGHSAVSNLLRQLQDDLGVAYLFITHNLGVVEYLAHEIAVMKDGRIIEAGTAEDVLDCPQHLYTQALLAAVPRVHHATEGYSAAASILRSAVVARASALVCSIQHTANTPMQFVAFA